MPILEDMADERVAAAWKRIEQALEQLAPGTSRTLGRGATDAELAALEKHLGFALPRDVRASLAHHAASPEAVLHGVLTPDAIASEHSQSDVWPRHRVPLAGDGGHYAVEVLAAGAPAEQIVWRWRDGTVEKRATWWVEILEREAALIEAGELTVVAGGLVRPPLPTNPSGLELDTSFRFISQPPASDPALLDSEPVIEHNTLTPPKE